MRKLGLFIIMCFLTSSANAGLINVHTLSADSTLAGLNDNFSTITDEMNGSIEGAEAGSTLNIKANTIGEADMGDSANPRIYSNEILVIGEDTSSTVQNSLVTSGLTMADTSGSLIGTLTAGIVYINGFRCSISQQNKTLVNNTTNWLDITQNCTVTWLENEPAEPSVTANSARIMKVVASGGNLTVTDLANRRLSSLIIPANYRDGLIVSYDSATTLVVTPGSVEINNTLVNISSKTSRTIGTPGHWASGSDDSSADSTNYVGVDVDGNVRLHTSGPTHQNYALTITERPLRYASWSSTTYRVLGWFRLGSGTTMAATVSQDTTTVSNIREWGLPNTGQIIGITDISSSAGYSDMDDMEINFYSSGNPVDIQFEAPIEDGNAEILVRLLVDSVEVRDLYISDAGGDGISPTVLSKQVILSEGEHSAKVQWATSSGGSNGDQFGLSKGERSLTFREN